MLKKDTIIKFLLSSVVLAMFFAPQMIFAQVNLNADVESRVRASFPDMPDMIAIAQCESGFRQFAPDGMPLRGGSSKRYIGIFQIDEKTHTSKASSMAYDINTVDGNIAYARYMFYASGTNPWKGCLGTPAVSAPITPIQPSPTPVSQAVPAPNPVVISGSLTGNLNFGMTNSQVVILQQILNKNGFVIASSGPGSPGNETAYFGALTREAVRKFQCAKSIACDGNEGTTGYGRVGPFTRNALNQLIGQ
jgi:hypothetical protein